MTLLGWGFFVLQSLHLSKSLTEVTRPARVVDLESQTCLVSSLKLPHGTQVTQLAKIEVVRFWIGLIRLFIDWPQHCEEPYYSLRTPKWAKNDY